MSIKTEKREKTKNNTRYYVTRIFLVVLLFGGIFIPGAVHAAIAKTGTDTSGTENALSLSFNHTLVSGSNRLVVVFIGIENGNTINFTGVTYGGVAMTRADSASTTPSGLRDVAELWYILEADLPADGSQTVAITGSGVSSTPEINALAAEYTGVAQTAPVVTDETAQTSGALVSNTGFSASAGDLLVSALGSGNIRVFVHGQNQNELIDFTDASSQFAATDLIATTSVTSLESIFTGTVNRSVRAAAQWSDAVTLEQEGFAFGDDDGSESAHTLDTQDSNVTEPLGAKTLRALVNATTDPASFAYRLRYQKNGSGGYKAVPVGTTMAGSTGAIEAGDVTESGNDTASGSWAVSTPSASAGDLIIVNLAWDDSTTVTNVTAPSGPNGESANLIQGPQVSANTAVRGKTWWYLATGSWTAGTLTFTPSASEQWTATVVKVLAGEFDSASPVGASSFLASTGTSNPSCPFLTAGLTDGGGRVVCWISGDTDDADGTVSGWTTVSSVDRGATGGDLQIRDTLASDSESISGSGWTYPSARDWVSFIYVVRAPLVTSEVYVSTSGNVAAGGEATTVRLSAPSGKTTGDFDTGRRWDNENGSDSIDVTADNYTELEWILTTQSPATDSDFFDFRLYIGDSPLDTYTVTPRWTIGSGASVPTVTTNFASNVGASSATLHGSITATGGDDADEHGFAYSTDSALSTSVSTTTLGAFTGVGNFSGGITGLSNDQIYYFRAYAFNTTGTSTGAILSFTTGNTTPTRQIRLFEGSSAKFYEGRIKLFQQ